MEAEYFRVFLSRYIFPVYLDAELGVYFLAAGSKNCGRRFGGRYLEVSFLEEVVQLVQVNIQFITDGSSFGT